MSGSQLSVLLVCDCSVVYLSCLRIQVVMGMAALSIRVSFVDLVALVSLLLMPVELCSRCLVCAADVIDAG